MEIRERHGDEGASGRLMAMAKKVRTFQFLWIEDSLAEEHDERLTMIKELNRVCEGCMLWRVKEPLELVYIDVCGLMRIPSHNQNRYFILFIDNYTRMTWVYILREKLQVFENFKKFKARDEKESGRHIKKIRSDRDKEYTSKEFDKYYEDEGLEHQLTIQCTP